MADQKVSSDPQRNLFNCESTSSPDPVFWSAVEESCPIHTLYLDDTGRTTTCVVGEDFNTKEKVLGPGPVNSLHWSGALDCVGSTVCSLVPLPSSRDALSDAQFGGLKTMQFLREKLGLMGGLSEDVNNPVPVKALVHYQEKYCNAFYR